MAVTIRVLGQAAPTATVETALYTCATTSAVISTLNICNFGASPDTFSVRVCVGGAADSNEQYVFPNTPIPANTVVPYTSGITLANTDVIKVVSANGTCAFQAFGQENA
jgi:hypothetical protein